MHISVMQTLVNCILHNMGCLSIEYNHRLHLSVTLLCFQRSLKDGRIAFKCSQPSCSHSMSLSAVSRSLQEIRADLEKAVDLMERQKPGSLDTVWKYYAVCEGFVLEALFYISVLFSLSLSSFRKGS